MDQYKGQPVVAHSQTSKNFGLLGGTLFVTFYTTPAGDPVDAPTRSSIIRGPNA